LRKLLTQGTLLRGRGNRCRNKHFTWQSREPPAWSWWGYWLRLMRVASRLDKLLDQQKWRGASTTTFPRGAWER